MNGRMRTGAGLLRWLGGPLAVIVAGASLSCSAPRRGPAKPRPSAPPPVTVLSSEPWTFGTTAGRVIRTPHFRLFTTLPPSLLRSRLPEFLEDSLTEYRTRFGPLPAAPAALDTYVVSGREQWSRLAARVIGPEAGAFQTIPRGGLTWSGRAVLYDIGARDTFALAAHEGWHQYTQSSFRAPLPLWLEEGLATTFEGFVWDPARPGRARFLPWSNLERFDQLRSAVTYGRMVPLTALLESDPDEVARRGAEAPLDYYAQLWALTMYLREGDESRYASGLRRLLADAAGGGAAGQTDLATLLSVYFSTDAPRLEAGFRRFIGRVIRPGARDLITRGDSPL